MECLLHLTHAAPKDPKWDTGTCYNWEYSALRTCCWQEPDILNPGETIARCQTCDSNGENCGSIFLERSPTGPLAPLEDGVLEQPPTPTPFDPTAPLQGGVLEQLQNDQPPLFGWNIPQGGFEVLQEPETPPMFGQVAPLTGGNAPLGFFGQEPAKVTTPTPTPTPRPTLTPTPIPTPTPEPIPVGPDLPPPFPPPTPGFEGPPIATDVSPDLAPEDDQDETDDGRNDIPDTGITEQPETQQPEDSSEGTEAAGPLT